MTYPIRTALHLAEEALKSCAPVGSDVLVEVELRDGTRWQVDGVKMDVSDLGVVKTFVLCVGPKEEK